MVASDADQNLQFGQFAVRCGSITESQLEAAIALWGQDTTRPLSEVLVELGALTEESLKSLETLYAAYLLCESRPEVMDDTVGHGELAGTDGPGASASSDGRFSRLQLHAEGGLGKVYEAHDRQLNRTVALKEIKGRYADDDNSRERFTREAEITGRLEHPGIVPVHALGKYPDGRPYYAMRMVKGDSLRRGIQRYHEEKSTDRATKSLEMRSLLGRFCDVCDAISYAHRRGIVHRDIKPSNILLGDYGETLVVDWGLAKTLGKREVSTTASIMPLEETLVPASGSGSSKTMVGKAVGSPAFMSPEQARGEHDEVGFASDIYGLGATLYMILTGKPPVEGQSAGELMSKVRKGEIVPPRSLDRSIPKSLEAICLKAIAYEPGDRYSKARDLRHDLDRFLADEPVAAYRENLYEKLGRSARRKRWLFPVILVGLLGLSALGAVITLLEQNKQAALAEAAKVSEQEIEAAFGQMVDAYRVIDPFADNDTNVRQLERECLRINESDISDISKAMVLDALVSQFKRFKRPEVATKWAQQAIDISKRLFGPNDRQTLKRQRALASVLRIDGKHQQAIELLEGIMGKLGDRSDEFSFGCLHDLAAIYMESGRVDQAIPLFRRVLRFREAEFGEEDYRTVIARHALGQALSKQHQHEEAIRLLDGVASSVSKLDEIPESDRLTMKSSAALARYRNGEYQESLHRYESLYPRYIDTLGPDHAHTLALLGSIASTQRQLGRFAEAIRNFRQVISMGQRVLNEQAIWHYQLGLGSALLGAGKFEEAVSEARPALESYTERLGFKPLVARLGVQTCASALIAMDRYSEAEPIVSLWRDAETDPELMSNALWASGEVSLGMGELDQAEDFAEQASTSELASASSNAQAGIDSLKGAIALARGDYQQAETLLLQARRRLEEDQSRLKPHQQFWPDRVRQRLETLHETQDQDQ